MLKAAVTDTAEAASTLSAVLDVFGAILIFAGAAFTLIAAIGLVRLKDLFSRTHASAKPQLLGLMFICAGLAVSMRTWLWLFVCVLVLAIQVIAAPVASHMLGRAAYRSGRAETESLVVDELEPK